MADRSEDEKAVLATLERMRTAFSERDFPAYASVALHADYTAWWTASPVGGIFVRQGWDDTADLIEDWVGTGSRGTRGGDAVVENLHISVSDNMAWVSFTRRYPNTPPHRASPNPAHHLRILEKVEGEWKIAVIATLDPSAGRPDSALIRLDHRGNVLWINESAAAALADDDDLVIRNGRLRIRNAAADRVLQSSIRWANELDRKFLPSRGAVPIVLEAGEGLATKVWWVIADSGGIFFSLGEPSREARQLDAAAAIYALSPAQKKVTAMIVSGQSIAQIAAHINVRPNTVRTHLDRVFEKTGVRTQSALVRVILSTAAPL